VWFETAAGGAALRDVVVDRRTRMLYDKQHVFINGESYRASGGDAALLRELADRGSLARPELAKASKAARSLLASWLEAGWVHPRKARR
jgi:50S ribosomal protein L16 3-hydroxylase